MLGNSLENQGKTRDNKYHVNTKLIVGNLSFNTTETDFRTAFAAQGTVSETDRMMDCTTGGPRGFGFITMSTPEKAPQAIDSLNGSTLDGRALTVNAATPREDRANGGRDHAGSGYGRRN